MATLLAKQRVYLVQNRLKRKIAMINPDVINNVIDTTEAIEVNANSSSSAGASMSHKATNDSESALMTSLGLPRSAIYLDRERSQIAFNWRVLAQAEDKSIPLLERLKY